MHALFLTERHSYNLAEILDIYIVYVNVYVYNLKWLLISHAYDFLSSYFYADLSQYTINI